MWMLALCCGLQLPEIALERDGLEIRQSCVLVAPKTPLRDARGDGLVLISGDGIEVELRGQLEGAPPDSAQDKLSGTAIRVTGKGVKLRGGRIRGFKCGLRATQADELRLEHMEFERNFAQRLRSTRAAEDSADWLWPHENDQDQWLERYGAAVWIEDSQRVELSEILVRAGQNGIVLDRVQHAKVYDCDASFLSGWGLALWRSSDNTIAHNAFDFCVRGYSHGIYNRGQDSAGLLLFEQCSRNVIAENSATHCGDGLFAFAGKQALGELPAPTGFRYERAGCNDNLFVGNDLSYAAAHGLELTFSFGNKILANRLVDNAICGIWGGYSCDMTIGDNAIEANGAGGYGAERGGIDIEHGQRNLIARNRFARNACGVRLWWDDDAQLLKSAWAQANGSACEGNSILGNRFEADALGVEISACSPTRFDGNEFHEVEEELHARESATTRDGPEVRLAWALPGALPGTHKPVGARAALRGREKILMTEWGPYDWQGAFLERLADAAPGHHYRLLGAAAPSKVAVTGAVELAQDLDADGRAHFALAPKRKGSVAPYELSVEAGSAKLRARDCLVDADWQLCSFACADPRSDEGVWTRALEGATRWSRAALELPFGMQGPSELPGAPAELAAAKLPRDHFGTQASARLWFARGDYEFELVSDDGVRLLVDGKALIDDWTWHAPKTARAKLHVAESREIALELRHFELDGFATLALRIERADASK